MPTREQITRSHLAQFRLHNGPPPDHQHQDRMITDPAYRAQQEGIARHEMDRIRNSKDGTPVGTIYYDPINHRQITVLFRMECAIFKGQEIIGIATYNPKRGREKFTSLPPEENGLRT